MMTLSKSEIHRLLIAVDRTQVSGQRDFLLFSFLEHTGLGVRECSWVLTGLVSDLGVPNQVLHITVPCRQGAALHKAIFLGSEAQGCIQEILEFNAQQGLSTAPASPLFQDERSVPLSIRSVVAHYQQRADELGL